MQDDQVVTAVRELMEQQAGREYPAFEAIKFPQVDDRITTLEKLVRDLRGQVVSLRGQVVDLQDRVRLIETGG